MLDTLVILFVTVAAVLVAYRAMALNNSDELPKDQEIEANEGPAKPKWAAGRQNRSWRPKR